MPLELPGLNGIVQQEGGVNQGKGKLRRSELFDYEACLFLFNKQYRLLTILVMVTIPTLSLMLILIILIPILKMPSKLQRTGWAMTTSLVLPKFQRP